MLNGRKRWITNSVVAAFVVVLARTGDRLSTFIVPTDTPGVRVGTPDRKYLWLLARNAQLDGGTRLEYLDHAHLLGYDLDKLIMPDQSGRVARGG